jgi:transposase-like protein
MRVQARFTPVEPGVMNPSDECPYEGCDSRYFKQHQEKCEKNVRDTKHEQVEAYRRKCMRCQRTHRVYPQGVSAAQQSERVRGLSIVLYILGLSYRGVESILVGLECAIDHVTVFRNVRAAGKKVRELRAGWLAQGAGQVRVVGGDLTYVRCRGEEVIIGVVVDAQQGITLDIKALDSQDTEALEAWLLPILDLVGAEVLLTDDADGFKSVADAAGVKHQICRRHVVLNVLDFVARTAQKVWRKPPPVPAELDVTVEQLLADLETLEWIMLGQPQQAPQWLAQMYQRYAHAPAPKKGQRASLWYRMRNRVLHLWNHWQRLTCHLSLRYTQDLEVDETNNCTERAIGWFVKQRYRTMRGYKQVDSILNVAMLTAWLVEQPPYTDLSPLFVS